MGCELRESQETTIARFLGGLNKEIADMIKRQPFVSLEDVIKLAVKVRRQRKRGQLTMPQVFNLKSVIAGSTPQGSASRWNEPRKEVEGSLKSQAESVKVTIQNPHVVESEVEEVVEDVCGVTSKEKVEYADKGEKLKAQQVVSSESKLEEHREYLENIPKWRNPDSYPSSLSVTNQNDFSYSWRVILSSEFSWFYHPPFFLIKFWFVSLSFGIRAKVLSLLAE
ncbi:hypothetical protein CRG98_018379 [Punica granatum]|uniref:Retrotransposon gag domain-containing protein n=1 Tax=Punica granatum TaxID=22663 RepID=A0A2I0JY54_PUNGR|nr:hypothetical protein CRG98_018379 [Punica granatum]